MPHKFKAYCVYTITCLVNDKIYIGAANIFKKRVGDHLYYLKNNKHVNKELQYDYNKYGKDNIVFDLVCEVPNKLDAFRIEKYYTDYILGINNNMCYNVSHGGGWHFTYEYNTPRKFTIEHKENMKKWQIGKTLSPEHKEKIRQKTIGRVHSKESRMKMREATLGGKAPGAKKVI